MKEYINNNTKPVFPVYDRDFNWKIFSTGPLPVIFDEFLYKNMSDDQFVNEFLGHKVIDCQGKEFIIMGRRMTSKWLKIIPGSKKFILEFMESGNMYSLDTMKNIIIEKIEGNIDRSDLRKSWVDEISKIDSITELLTGEG